MESIQDTRMKGLKKAEILLQQVKSNVELDIFDDDVISELKEAMELFEKWKAVDGMADSYEYWGDYQIYETNPKIALEYFQKSLEVRKSCYGEQHSSMVRSYYSLGKAENALMNLQLSEEYLQKALDLGLTLWGENHLLIVKCHNLMSINHSQRKKYKKSLDCINAGMRIINNLPKTISNQYFLGTIYANLAIKYLETEEFLKSSSYFKKSILIFQKVLPANHKHLGMTYTNYGVLLRYSADFHKSNMFLHKALDIFLSYQSDSYLTSFVYYRLGLNFGEQILFAKMIEYCHQALSALQKAGMEDFSFTLQICRSLGDAYRKEGNLLKSGKYFHKSLKIATDLYGSDGVTVATCHKFLATYEIARNNTSKAKEHLQTALEIINRAENFSSIALSDIWTHFGYIYTKEQQFLDALQYHHKALACFAKKTETEGVYDFFYKTVEDNQFSPENYSELINCFDRLVEAFYDYYIHGNGETKDLKAAFRACTIILELVDFICQSFQSDWSKLAILKKVQTSLDKALKINFKLFDVTQSDIYNKRAFEISEKSKAYLMLLHAQDKNAKQNTHIPQELLQLEADLKSKLHSLEKNIQIEKQKGDATRKKNLLEYENNYFITFNEFESLKKQLENEYPDYQSQKHSLETVLINKFQFSLQEDQAVLSYFIAEEKIYLFAITFNEYEVFSLEKPDNWTNLIQNYLQSIKLHQKTEFHRLSFELYQILLQEAMHHLIDPFEDDPKQVFIIPHAELHYLPFETLIIQEAEASKPYQELDYLLNHCQISYHYSATLLHLDLQKQAIVERAPAEITFTGFAPVYDSTSATQQKALEILQKEPTAAVNRSEAVRGDGTWMPLPYSKIEVENIAQLFEKQGLKSQSFLHSAANKSNLEEQIGKSRFVLIAAHGIVNDEYPELSGLVLASKTADGGTDGTQEVRSEERSLEEVAVEDCILNMKEVAMIPMSADLVVLSSCESGIGELHKGEGMMAVNRGFWASGAKNVVSTLFKVNDQSSSELTQLLFAYILKGESYSTALQKAKLELLKKEGMSPKSWSGFVLFGKGV